MLHRSKKISDLDLLGSFIQIESLDRRIENSFDRVCFYLDPEIINRIRATQTQRNYLTISPSLLTSFRYYVLRDVRECLQSGLIFYTYYCSLPVIKTTIFLNGEVINQIRYDCLKSPELIERILNIHYWVIEQMLRQLPLPKHLNLLYFLALISVGVIAIGIFVATINSSWAIIYALIAIVVMAIVYQKKIFLEIKFKRWLLYQKLFNLKSK